MSAPEAPRLWAMPAAPPTDTPASPPTTRSLAPDLARGFMLLLIAVANSAWYLWGHTGSLTSQHPTDGTQLDRTARAIMSITVDGRILPLFAFLFGYGMVQFARSRSARGIQPVDIKRMLRRRHLALLLLGFLHALLLFGGDILGAYGVLGLILMLAFEATNRTLRIVFWALVAYALVSGIIGMISLWQLETAGLDLAAMPAGMEFTLADLQSGLGNYLIAMGVRVGFWLISTPTLIFTGVAPAAILLGWLFARHGVLEHPERWRPQLTRLAVGGIAVGWLTGIPVALEHLGRPLLSPALSLGYMSINYAGGTAAGIGYAAAVALLAARIRARPGPVAQTIAAVGKRSLTFYLFQSLLFAPLLAAWGLGLGSRINTTGAVLMSLGIWALSLLVAAVLESRSVRGPMEVVLRRLTYVPQDRLTPARSPWHHPPQGNNRMSGSLGQQVDDPHRMTRPPTE